MTNPFTHEFIRRNVILDNLSDGKAEYLVSSELMQDLPYTLSFIKSGDDPSLHVPVYLMGRRIIEWEYDTVCRCYVFTVATSTPEKFSLFTASPSYVGGFPSKPLSMPVRKRKLVARSKTVTIKGD